MNRINNAFTNLGKAKTTKAKHKAQVELSVEYISKEGKKTIVADGRTPKDFAKGVVDRARKALEKVGKDLDQLDPVTANQVLQVASSIYDPNAKISAKIAGLMAERQRLLDGKNKSVAVLERIKSLNIQIAKLQTRQGRDLQAAVISATSSSGSGSGSGSGGGGGGGQKSIGEQLKDELKQLTTTFDSIRKLLRGKNEDFKNVMAGPFAPEFIEYLKSQGEAGIKMLKEQGKKFYDAYKTFVKIQLQTNKNFMQNLPVTLANQARATMGRSKAEQKLISQGIGPDQVGSILDSIAPGTLALYETATRNVKRISKRKFDGKSYQDLNKRQQANVLKQLSNSERQAFTMFEPNSRLMKSVSMNNLATASVNLKNAKNELESFNKFAKLGIDPTLAQSFTELGITADMALKMPKGALEDLKNGLKAINTAKKIQEIGTSLRDMVISAKNVKMVADTGITGELGQELSDLIGTADLTSQQFSEITRAFILTKMQVNKLKSDIDKLNTAMQISVDISQTQLDAINASNNARNVEIDRINDANAIIQHSIDLENDKKQDHQDQIDIYQKQMEAEQELYDERIKALEEIEKANEIIRQQQQDQLNVAQALSRGDVAAAAQAALNLQQNLAKNREQETKDALQKQHEAYVLEMQKKIKKERDAMDEIDKNIKIHQDAIKANNYSIYSIQQSINESKEKQRQLEEDIYKRQLLQSIIQTENAITAASMVGDLKTVSLLQGQLKTQLSVAGKDQKEQDSFFSKIQGGQQIVASATAMTTAKPEDLIIQGLEKATLSISTAFTNFQTWFQGQLNSGNLAAKTDLQAVLDQLFTKGKYTLKEDGTILDKDNKPISGADFVTFLSSANLQLFDFVKDGGPMNKAITSASDALLSSASTIAQIPGAATAIYNAFKAAEAALQGKIDEANNTKPKDKGKGSYFGGRISKFATGSWVPGIGNSDTVPAMLTPGEFVVRKSVAQEFGPLLTSLNGNVFPSMNGGISIEAKEGPEGGPVQYNYDISVNIAGTNASPDEIANAVMSKIKMTEDRKLRSYKY